MKYEVQVKLNDVWQTAHVNQYASLAEDVGGQLARQHREVRILQHGWFRKNVLIWYNDTSPQQKVSER